MPSIRQEDLSPFARLALKLDSELAELVRAGEQIAKLNLESDSGFDEGVRILNRVSQYGQSAAVTMQGFSAALQEARDKAEAATGLVAERAQLIQKRKQEQDLLGEALSKIKDEVAAAGAGLSAFAKPQGEASEDDRRRIASELERLREPMAKHVEAIKALKARAAEGGFKRLERQAESMVDSLQSTLRKIAQALP